MSSIEFAKGHGTRNDFVLYVDRDASHEPSIGEVAFLCDRRAGIGADGILRAVETDRIPGWTGPGGLWFMDYRNADGSIAEMCGNGLRVFLRYLAEEGLVDSTRPVKIATRAGLRTGRFFDDGRIAVTMGTVSLGATVSVELGSRSWTGQVVDVGNPHAVVALGAAESLADLDLSRPPIFSPQDRFPDGANVEFFRSLSPGRVQMRVYERGVGETQSCGTGVVAVASVAAPDSRCVVAVRGGELEVDLTGPEAVLRGPAVIVARGRCQLPSGLAQPESR